MSPTTKKITEKPDQIATFQVKLNLTNLGNLISRDIEENLDDAIENACLGETVADKLAKVAATSLQNSIANLFNITVSAKK
jgi:hypothetical protein